MVSLRPTASCGSILSIFFRCSYTKVFWVTTRWIITGVKYIVVFADSPLISQGISYTMRKMFYSFLLYERPPLSVTGFVVPTGPGPTFVWVYPHFVVLGFVPEASLLVRVYPRWGKRFCFYHTLNNTCVYTKVANLGKYTTQVGKILVLPNSSPPHA